METKENRFERPKEENEKIDNKQICGYCGNDSFRVYTNIIIDDARLYCSKCDKFWY
jgi:hypothetical protein